MSCQDGNEPRSPNNNSEAVRSANVERWLNRLGPSFGDNAILNMPLEDGGLSGISPPSYDSSGSGGAAPCPLYDRNLNDSGGAGLSEQNAPSFSDSSRSTGADGAFLTPPPSPAPARAPSPGACSRPCSRPTSPCARSQYSVPSYQSTQSGRTPPIPVPAPGIPCGDTLDFNQGGAGLSSMSPPGSFSSPASSLRTPSLGSGSPNVNGLSNINAPSFNSSSSGSRPCSPHASPANSLCSRRGGPCPPPLPSPGSPCRRPPSAGSPSIPSYRSSCSGRTPPIRIPQFATPCGDQLDFNQSGPGLSNMSPPVPYISPPSSPFRTPPLGSPEGMGISGFDQPSFSSSGSSGQANVSPCARAPSPCPRLPSPGSPCRRPPSSGSPSIPSYQSSCSGRTPPFQVPQFTTPCGDQLDLNQSGQGLSSMSSPGPYISPMSSFQTPPLGSPVGMGISGFDQPSFSSSGSSGGPCPRPPSAGSPCRRPPSDGCPSIPSYRSSCSGRTPPFQVPQFTTPCGDQLDMNQSGQGLSSISSPGPYINSPQSFRTPPLGSPDGMGISGFDQPSFNSSGSSGPPPCSPQANVSPCARVPSPCPRLPSPGSPCRRPPSSGSPSIPSYQSSCSGRTPPFQIPQFTTPCGDQLDFNQSGQGLSSISSPGPYINSPGSFRTPPLGSPDGMGISGFEQPSFNSSGSSGPQGSPCPRPPSAGSPCRRPPSDGCPSIPSYQSSCSGRTPQFQIPQCTTPCGDQLDLNQSGQGLSSISSPGPYINSPASFRTPPLGSPDGMGISGFEQPSFNSSGSIEPPPSPCGPPVHPCNESGYSVPSYASSQSGRTPPIPIPVCNVPCGDQLNLNQSGAGLSSISPPGSYNSPMASFRTPPLGSPDGMGISGFEQPSFNSSGSSGPPCGPCPPSAGSPCRRPPSDGCPSIPSYRSSCSGRTPPFQIPQFTTPCGDQLDLNQSGQGLSSISSPGPYINSPVSFRTPPLGSPEGMGISGFEQPSFSSSGSSGGPCPRPPSAGSPCSRPPSAGSPCRRPPSDGCPSIPSYQSSCSGRTPPFQVPQFTTPCGDQLDLNQSGQGLSSMSSPGPYISPMSSFRTPPLGSPHGMGISGFEQPSFNSSGSSGGPCPRPPSVGSPCRRPPSDGCPSIPSYRSSCSGRTPPFQVPQFTTPCGDQLDLNQSGQGLSSISSPGPYINSPGSFRTPPLGSPEGMGISGFEQPSFNSSGSSGGPCPRPPSAGSPCRRPPSDGCPSIPSYRSSCSGRTPQFQIPQCTTPCGDTLDFNQSGQGLSNMTPPVPYISPPSSFRTPELESPDGMGISGFDQPSFNSSGSSGQQCSPPPAPCSPPASSHPCNESGYSVPSYQSSMSGRTPPIPIPAFTVPCGDNLDFGAEGMGLSAMTPPNNFDDTMSSIGTPPLDSPDFADAGIAGMYAPSFVSSDDSNPLTPGFDIFASTPGPNGTSPNTFQFPPTMNSTDVNYLANLAFGNSSASSGSGGSIGFGVRRLPPLAPPPSPPPVPADEATVMQEMVQSALNYLADISSSSESSGGVPSIASSPGSPVAPPIPRRFQGGNPISLPDDGFGRAELRFTSDDEEIVRNNPDRAWGWDGGYRMNLAAELPFARGGLTGSDFSSDDGEVQMFGDSFGSSGDDSQLFVAMCGQNPNRKMRENSFTSFRSGHSGNPLIRGSPQGSPCNRTFDITALKMWVMKLIANACQGQCGKPPLECQEHTLKYLMSLVSSWRNLCSLGRGNMLGSSVHSLNNTRLSQATTESCCSGSCCKR